MLHHVTQKRQLQGAGILVETREIEMMCPEFLDALTLGRENSRMRC
jgi:hypothetical protein